MNRRQIGIMKEVQDVGTCSLRVSPLWGSTETAGRIETGQDRPLPKVQRALLGGTGVDQAERRRREISKLG
jgi:hypothetical protein